MKRIFTLFALITTIAINAQAPQGFNYQATVRNSSGQLLVNQIVLIKFNVLQNSANGTIVYSETQTANTDDLGQINLVVGQGTAPTGTFSTINWGSGSYYLGIELNSGSGYVAMGNTQLMSVPYALNGITTTQADAIVAMQAKIAEMQAQITSLLPTIITTTIGTQEWTTKNLDVATYSDGTIIPEVQDPQQWANLTTGAWCYYNNTTANGTTYGKLYNWYAEAGIHDTDPNTPNKKLAPSGYHVPSDAEWTTLTDNLGGASIAGGKMKEVGTTYWNTPNLAADNSSGFTALPGGGRDAWGDFVSLGTFGNWWVSTEYNQTNSWVHYIQSNLGVDFSGTCNAAAGFSVRLLRNK